MAAFRWTPETIEAAQLVADGELAYAEIAEKLGVGRMTVWNWRQNPEFMARVNDHVEEYASVVRRRGIARLERRVAALNDRWRRMQQVIEARAKAYEKDTHGAATGLLVQKIRWEGKGEDATAVIEYELDAALLKELREHEKQAAQELGQWTEKKEVTGPDGGTAKTIDLKGLSDDELATLERLSDRITRPVAVDPGVPGGDAAGD